MNPTCWVNEYLLAERDDAVMAADALIRENNCTPGNARVLFAALDATGDEKYREAIRQVMAQLDAREASADAPLAEMCEVLPFCMEYEMKLNRMERVGQTAAAYRSAHARWWDPQKGRHNVPLAEDTMFLLALVQGVAQCSEMLYEHWRALVDIYRVTLRGVLAEAGEAEPHTLAMVIWALLCGVQQGLIDPERYLPEARKAVAVLRTQGENVLSDRLEDMLRGLA